MIFLRIQKINRICLKALAAAVAVVAFTNVYATSRIGEAEVRLENGLPCFTITNKEENRAGAPQLRGLKVYDASVKPSIEVWFFTLPIDARQTISSNTCISYGKAPLGAESTKAIQLAIGKVYEVAIKGKLNDSSDPTFWYEAKFCLIRQSNDEVQIHQIIYDKGWRYEKCKL